MWGFPLPSLPPSGARVHVHVAPHRGRVGEEGGGEGPNQRTSRLLLHLQPPRNSEGRQASASARPAACASASKHVGVPSPIPATIRGQVREHLLVLPHRGRVGGGGEGPNQRTSRLLLHLQPPRNGEGRQASASARPAACASASCGTLWCGNRNRRGGRGGGGGGGQWAAPARA